MPNECDRNEAITEAVIYATADDSSGTSDGKRLKGREYRNLAGGASLRRIEVSSLEILATIVTNS